LGKEAFRNSLPTTFMFKFFAALRATAQPALASVAEPYVRPVSSGTQAFKTVLPADHPGSSPTAKAEATEQASGETVFHDDIQVARPLYGALVMATQAPALVTGIDPAAALAMPGVVDFVSHEDIPGTNLCNPLGSDELLLVKIYDPAAATGTAEEVAKVRHESTVHFIGQAVGLVVHAEPVYAALKTIVECEEERLGVVESALGPLLAHGRAHRLDDLLQHSRALGKLAVHS